MWRNLECQWCGYVRVLTWNCMIMSVTKLQTEYTLDPGKGKVIHRLCLLNMWYMLLCASIESVAAVPPVIFLLSSSSCTSSEFQLNQWVTRKTWVSKWEPYICRSSTTYYDCQGKVCNIPLLLGTFILKQFRSCPTPPALGWSLEWSFSHLSSLRPMLRCMFAGQADTCGCSL